MLGEEIPTENFLRVSPILSQDCRDTYTFATTCPSVTKLLSNKVKILLCLLMPIYSPERQWYPFEHLIDVIVTSS